MNHVKAELQVFKRLAATICFGRIEEIKSTLVPLPYESKIFYNNTCITFSDGLSIFARLERAYYSLQFLSSKSIFYRKEDYELSYRALQRGYEQVADIVSSEQPSKEYRTAMRIAAFCSVRSRLVALYPFLKKTFSKSYLFCSVNAAYRSIDENPLKLLTEIDSFHQSVVELLNQLVIPEDDVSQDLEPLSLLIHSEVIGLAELLKTQSWTSDLYFLDSLLCLKSSFSELSNLFQAFKLTCSLLVSIHNGITVCAWFFACFYLDAHFLKFPLVSMFGRHVNKPPALLSWLSNFYNTLLAKYSLYWFNILNQAVSSSDTVLEISSSEDPSLIAKVIAFQRRTNALCVSLFFDTACQTNPFLGHGYVLRGTVGDGPKGVESIPVIFMFPLDYVLPSADIYAIVMQISGTLNVGELEEFQKLVYSCDEKRDRTYFIQKLEFRVFLALVYEGCRSRKDRQITDFMSSLGNVIRLQTLVASLRSH
ncbi:hypothetical protein PHET_02741 [Paragonimus heterotremus]|uniref:Uncharacterized protein n=1 Tax=Paragonimus heterotremus TaxID=100268 RepID=A0A8J4T3R2_9TREM|nr:hypothetical protein PHET_02741 [Paragonimus heterotremus]